jgi:hypothetical protein
MIKIPNLAQSSSTYIEVLLVQGNRREKESNFFLTQIGVNAHQ